MKLADDALIMLMEIFRQGIMELKDISQGLREIDLVPDSSGKLTLRQTTWDKTNETD